MATYNQSWENRKKAQADAAAKKAPAKKAPAKKGKK